VSEVIIAAQRSAREANLTFYPDSDAALDELHDEVVGSVDGVSAKSGIEDFIVTIRERDFDEVVARLAESYRSRGYEVTVKTTA
jgi:hypothetical protein